MASIIRIKRSSTSGNPSTLGAGELAYSALTDNGSNGGDRLYIGMGTETAGNAVNHVIIGGKYYTGLVDAGGSGGTLNTSAKSIPVLSATGTIDKWLVGNLQLTGNTLSSTNTNGDVIIQPNGTGKVSLYNPYINQSGTLVTLDEYVYDLVGGTITAGTGITSTVSDAGNTTTLSITNTGVTAGTYGSATAIPTFTVNAQGQITSASTAALATTLNISGDTGTSAFALLTDTMTFVGGTGIDSIVSKVGAATSVTFNIDSTVATLTGTQTLTNKSISGSTNTLTNIGNSSLVNSSVTINGTSISLGSTATITAAAGTLTGTTLNSTVVSSSLTSVGTITSGTWNGTTIAVANGGTGTTNGSITGTGALTFTAGGTNNNVNLNATGTGTIDVGNARITSVATPTQATDAANKAYVDSSAAGLNVKNPVQAATTTALTVTYFNGTSGVGATLTNAGIQAALTIDSQVFEIGDRILVKDQATASQNGIYTVTVVGSASTNWVMTRATDADNNTNGGKLTPNAFVFVEEGTVNANNGYTLQIAADDQLTYTLGTDPIVWVQFSGAGEITAGNGLTKTGNTIDVVGTTNRITANADSIDIAATYVGQTSITTLGTVTTGTWQASVLGSTYGGTGVNNGSNTITLGGNISTAGSFTTAGAYALTLTTTGATNVTLPTTGTLATLAGTETLSNKTITSSSFSGSTGSFTGNVTVGGTLGVTGATTLSSTLGVTGNVTLSANLTGAGAATSTIDGFQIDGGTY